MVQRKEERSMARSNLELALAMGKRMAEKRKERGLTQESVAYKAGMTHQQYNKAENGKTCLGSDSLLRLSSVLETSADYLLRGQIKSERYRETLELLDKMTDSQVQLANKLIQCVIEYEQGRKGE